MWLIYGFSGNNFRASWIKVSRVAHVTQIRRKRLKVTVQEMQLDAHIAIQHLETSL